MTLKQKLKKIDPVIAWMIMENTKEWHKTRRDAISILNGYKNITFAFHWKKAMHIPDFDFWWGIDVELNLMEDVK